MDPKDRPRIEDLPTLEIVPVEQPPEKVSPAPPLPADESWVWSWPRKRRPVLPS